MTSALIREGERDLRQAEQEKIQRADRMKVELKIRVMCHKQECLKPPEAEATRRTRIISLLCLQRQHHPLTP